MWLSSLLSIAILVFTDHIPALSKMKDSEGVHTCRYIQNAGETNTSYFDKWRLKMEIGDKKDNRARKGRSGPRAVYVYKQMSRSVFPSTPRVSGRWS